MIAGLVYWRRRDLDPWLGPMETVVAPVADTPPRTPGPVPVRPIQAEPQAAATSLRLTITADPAAQVVDPVGHVVPAHTVDIPLSAQVVIQPTETALISRRASGVVRFTSRDARQVFIQPGMAVATADGVVFRLTDGAVLAPSDGEPRSVDIPIEAGAASAAANVPAHAIRILPAQLERMAVTVTNDAPITGGARHEAIRFSRADYDRGVEALTAALWAELATRLSDGRADAGGTRYVHAESAELASVRIEPTPHEVIDLQADSVVLSARATASALAVELADVRSLLTAYVLESAPHGTEIDPLSVRGRVVAAEASANGLALTVEATAWQVRAAAPPARVH